MNIRAATLLDAEMLFQWRNDPKTLASLPIPYPILKENHWAWMTQRLTLPHFYMAEEQNQVVGTARLEARYEIAITIAPNFQGRGFSVPLIRQVTAQAVNVPVLARIVIGNDVSVKAFLKAGFVRDPVDLYIPQ